jgi:hypothetical protein
VLWRVFVPHVHYIRALPCRFERRSVSGRRLSGKARMRSPEEVAFNFSCGSLHQLLWRVFVPHVHITTRTPLRRHRFERRFGDSRVQRRRFAQVLKARMRSITRNALAVALLVLWHAFSLPHVHYTHTLRALSSV